MSVRTLPIKKVINSIDANTVTVSGTEVTIRVPGAPPVSFDSGDVVECSRTCAADCTPGVWSVTPIVPVEPCNCPFEFTLILKPIPCPGQVGLVGEGNFNGGFGQYSVNLPSGVTPTVAQIVVSIVEQVNSDPYRFVTAAAVGGTGTETSFTLTERNCDIEYSSGFMRRTCGVRVLVNSGTIVNSTPHVSSVYSANDAFRDFPVGHGQFGVRSDLTACGAYCKYYFRIVPTRATAPAHMLNHGYVTREMELEFVVNSSDTNFVDMFNDELSAVIDCIEDWA
jgi:hypothetical protein